MKPALYLLFPLVPTVFLTIWSGIVGRRRLFYIAKPLSTLLVIIAAGASFLEPNRNLLYTGGVLIGLVLSLSGDVALVLEGKSAFLWGLRLFLAAHIAYTAVFMSLGRFSPRDIPSAILLFLAGAGFYALIRPGLGPLKGPVIAYMVIISLMVHRALSTLTSPLFSPAQATMIAVGALLFYASDVILAANKFWKPWRYHRFSLALYYGGQFLIALAASYFR